MNETDRAKLFNSLKGFAKAKSPINPGLFEKIPYFKEIFPDKNLWNVLARLSGDDGIAHFEHKFFEKGQKIIAKGEFDQMIFWILSGSAQIVTEIGGQPKIIHEARKGECVGELGVLRGQVRTADVIAGDQGLDVIELDWAVTEKCHILGKDFYYLIALNLADKLDSAYGKQLKIISNSINILHQKTSQLIDRNRKLEAILKENNISYDNIVKIEQEEVLSHAISSIKESLSLLKTQENRNNLDELGVV